MQFIGEAAYRRGAVYRKGLKKKDPVYRKKYAVYRKRGSL